MVRNLRQSIFGQLFLGSVVAAIIAAFLLSGNSGGGGASDECAVEVGKTCVQPKDFVAAYGLLSSIGLNEKAAKELQLKKMVALGLAERVVLEEEARRLGISTSEEDLDRELADGRTRISLPASDAERLALSLRMCVEGPTGCEPGTIGLRALPVKSGGAFNYEVYKRNVRIATGRSPNQFKELQKHEHNAERVRQVIRSQVKVSDEEAYLTYRRARAQATARIANLQTAWFARYAVNLDDETLASWVTEHQEDVSSRTKQLEAGWADGCRVLSEIRLAPQIDEDEDEDEPTKKLERLAIRAKIQKNWESLAREHSSAPSARLGGRLGCVTAATYGPGGDVIEAAAAELAKVGDVSGVIETPEGPTILRLDGIVDGENRAELLDAYVSYQLAMEALAQAAALEFAKKVISELQAKKPLADVLETLSLTTLAAGPLGESDAALESNDRPLSDISRPFSIEQSPVSNAVGTESPAPLVFGLENDDDVVARPIETITGFVVLQLKSKDDLTREEFAEDRDRIVAQLVSRKSEEALADFVAKLIERAGGVVLNERYVPPAKAEEQKPSEG